MDLSKAFYSMTHNLLIKKIHAYGFSIDVVTFFYSYLKRLIAENKNIYCRMKDSYALNITNQTIESGNFAKMLGIEIHNTFF